MQGLPSITVEKTTALCLKTWFVLKSGNFGKVRAYKESHHVTKNRSTSTERREKIAKFFAKL